MIVDDGETLINCLAYIDLNPVRAGIISKPEEYRWCSLGYHAQTGNRDGFLSTDFGLPEFALKGAKARLAHYRRFVYEYFSSRHEKRPKLIQELDGIYSLKRLSESIA